MNRRDFLQGAAAGVSLAALGRRPSVACGMLPIIAVVYDGRFGAARAFADRHRCDGATAFPTGGDPAALWYGDLGALLRRQGGRVAGLTTYPDLVIARSCGRDLALRLAFAQSRAADSGVVQKQVLRLRHPRESGDPRFPLDSRFRGNDDLIRLFHAKPLVRVLTSWLLEPRRHAG